MPMILPPALDVESRDTRSSPPENGDESSRAARVVEGSLLLLAAVLFGLYFVHLRADFPNHSLWMDWAKYTDEGWYGDAAIRHYQLGHWNVPGDFNPAAALPMWPLLEAMLFRITGVSLVAARALSVSIFGLSLLSGYLLLRRWTAETGAGMRSLAPAIAVLLLAANPFSYVFNRLAILEPLLVLLTLLALLAASSAGPKAVLAETVPKEQKSWAAARLWMPTVWLGLLLPMMVLTKTTALFLFPGLLWMLWAATGYQRKPFLKAAALSGGLGAGAWLAYFLFYVRPHFLADYRYLFSANGYTKVSLDNFKAQLLGTVNAGMGFGRALFVVALVGAGVVLVSVWRNRLRTNPLSIVLLLWIVGYSAFMVYHANIQSRYYLLLVTPYTLLAVNAFEPLMARLPWFGRSENGDGTGTIRMISGRKGMLLDAAALAVVGALAVGLVQDARTTVGFVRHPEYTFVNAAAGIHDAIERERAAHPDHSRLLLSISGSDISLITGIPSICDDFGTMELVDRLAAYKPGWFATWNYIEDDKMDAMTPTYHLERVAAFPAFDDPDRNLLILYRLDPSNATGRSRNPSRRRYMNNPRRLKAKPTLKPAVPAAH